MTDKLPGAEPQSEETIAKIFHNLEIVISHLKAAREEFLVGANGGRRGAIMALNAVMSFFSAIEPESADELVPPHNLTAPLAALFYALSSLDEGQVRPLLAPSPMRRGKVSSRSRLLKAYCVHTVELIHDAGYSYPDAYDEVADTLLDLGVSNAGNSKATISARTIKKWREEISEDPKSLLATQYNAWVQRYDAFVGHIAQEVPQLPSSPRAKAVIAIVALRYGLSEFRPKDF